MQKELSIIRDTDISDSGTVQEFNININPNELMVKLLIATRQLDSNTQDYIFDYDNQFRPVGMYDSTRRYKKRWVIFK
jgi:hypothetical protein